MNWTVRELNSDMTDVTEGPPLALKLSWVRRTSPTEQELQGSIPIDNVGVILSSVKSGFVDSYGFSAHNTQRFRHGIQVTKVARHWSEGKPGPVEPRVLVKTLLQTSGWPVRFFTDLTELVRTIRDALQGHHNLYFKNGVLHRNVTPDNILICPTDFKSSDLDLGFTTSGCVVDLDHAKQSSQRIKYDPRGLSNVDDEIWALNIKCNDYAGFGPKLDDIWRRCQGVRNNALTFADELKRLENIVAEPVRDKVMDALCFPSEEQYRRWVDESQSVSRPPSWKDVLVDGPDRTGTFLFMSSEMIYGHSYSPGSLNDNYPQHHRSDIGKMGPIHTAIHDIESFFWVLVYECFVRDGPGGRRRPQVMPGRSMTTHLNILFNNKNAQKKFELFRNPDLFEKDVVSFFHPYFNRLKPLVREWWHILICTYRTSDDVTQGLIHDKIIWMLNKHLDIIVSGEPDEAETREKVIQRGKAELQRRMNMCKKLIVSTLLYDQDGSVGDNEDDEDEDEDDEDEDDEDEDENTEDED
ncbi:hypothetical protein EUX98_g6840 [Antrodiella citrinella]|uniref:Fungal-type protein kinase domain-containing protein n=1 Tax=Antrodiella citrinella TaxID=2447956 RepID=A0A4S4MN60_9APHY|nr:hypothetical protein EUX98_g6840 [Antrodiella citrinella]